MNVLGTTSELVYPPAAQYSRGWSPSWRFLLDEAVGSLGDLGTFFPIVIGLVQFAGFDAATILVFAGLMNIFSGSIFRIPLAVQPMKAVAALAIAGALTAGQAHVAGLFVGTCVLVMAATKGVRVLERILPDPVLRGIQLAVAFKLLTAGVTMGLADATPGAVHSVRMIQGMVPLGAVVALLWVFRRRLSWAVLALLAAGFVAAAVREPSLAAHTNIALWRPRLALPDASAVSGIWLGGLAQLPLTLLNSVFAVSILAQDLFPTKRERATSTRIALSVGLMNLISCPFGGMPVCHGSGGLAGQHQFGARTGLSMVMLGTAKLLVGLLFGAAAMAWMKAFPTPLLAAFLLVAGFGLAKASRFWHARQNLVVGLATVAAYAATGLLPAGFAAGRIAHAIMKLRSPAWQRRRSADEA